MELNNLPIRSRLQMLGNDYSAAEQKIADYLKNNGGSVIDDPIIVFAQRIGVSEATVIRFCKRIGLSGYTELKLKLAVEMGETLVPDDTNLIDGLFIQKDDQLETITQKIITNTINGLRDIEKTLDNESYIKAVCAIAHARQVCVFAVANSYVVADDIFNKLTRLGIPCGAYSDSHLQVMAAVNMKKGDVAIGISHSGQSIDTVEAVRAAREAGATTICISNHMTSPLIEVSDIQLLTSAHEVTFSSETMVSRISQLAIVDMLYCGLILSDYDRNCAQISKMNEALINKSF